MSDKRIIDSIATWEKLVAKYPGNTPGIDAYPAGAIPGAAGNLVDLSHGFSFQADCAATINESKIMVRQRVSGGGLQMLLFNGRQGAGEMRWVPENDSSPIDVLKLIEPWPMEDYKNAWTIATFRPETPIELEPNRPYVLVFDPMPEPLDKIDGAGNYGLAVTSSVKTFQSDIGATALWDGKGIPPENVSVIMAPFVINRQFYLTMTPQKTRWEIALRNTIVIASVL
jgi:hypothetical protein